MNDMTNAEHGVATAPHRSKTLAGALALFFGWAGAHRLYLGSRIWWLYPLFTLPTMGLALSAGGDLWYRHPGFWVAGLAIVVAMLEAILICLAPDERWDARHNPDTPTPSSSGWGTVLIAIVALTLGNMLLMSVMALSFEALFESLRSQTM